MFEHLKQTLRDTFDSTPKPPLHLEGPLVPIDNKPAAPTVRDTLFGDTDLRVLVAQLAPDALVHEPWSIFAKASKAAKPDAVAALEPLRDHPESRVRLLAWHALRLLGVEPPPELYRQVLGVVVEVAVNGGTDLVAAYPEHTARYYNSSGAGVIWETGNPRLNPQIDALLASGRTVAEAIGPWDKERPAPPGPGRIRLNILTPGGLYIGEGPMDGLSRDTLGGPVVKAAFDLMQALMQVDKEAREKP